MRVARLGRLLVVVLAENVLHVLLLLVDHFVYVLDLPGILFEGNDRLIFILWFHLLKDYIGPGRQGCEKGDSGRLQCFAGVSGYGGASEGGWAGWNIYYFN